MTFQSDFADVAVIGGGAAGLASAIFAAEVAPPGHRILIIDSATKLGAKILVSGGGRCNVTHYQVSTTDFHGSRNYIRNVLAAFGVSKTIEWFESMGVNLKREPTGKMFPVSDSARSVVDALLNRCKELNISFLLGEAVKSVLPPTESEPAFHIQTGRGTIRARRVIFCTGGRSLPRTGSDGGGWQILKELGHTVLPTYAALVPLTLQPQMFHANLAGLSQEVELSTFLANKRVDHRVGSMLWTHFGISGPVVMDASRFWTMAAESQVKLEMRCNLLPGETFETVVRSLIQVGKDRPKVLVITFLTTRLSKRLLIELFKHLGVEPDLPAGQLSREARRLLVHALTALPLPISQHRGWNYAEVTAGGVPLDEIDYRTMESRKVPGLYLAGEVLDCDGRIGGFNFQWAWASGYLAGRASVRG